MNPVSSSQKIDFYHQCELPKDDDTLKVSPFAARIHKLWFKFDKFKTVVESERTHMYFRSNKAIAKERSRHLRTPEFKYSIHPLSKLAGIQNTIICPVWFILLMLGPLFGAFDNEVYIEQTGEAYLLQVITICRVVIAVDIVVRFFRGYVIEKTGKIVLDRRSIVEEYIKTYFFVDLSIPVTGIVLFLLPYSAKTARLITCQLSYIAIARVKSLIQKLELFCRCMHMRQELRTCFFLLTLAMFLIHWWTCLLRLTTVVYEQYNLPQRNTSWYYIWQNDQKLVALTTLARSSEYGTSDWQTYIIYLSVVLSHFSGTWLGRYQTKDCIEMVLLSLILMSGMMFCIYAMAQILQSFGTVNFSEIKYDHLIYQAEQYMIKQRYPRRLKKRVLTYYDYKFDKKYFSEQIILTGLSEHLRMEVVLYSCKTLVTNLQHFKNLSKAATGSLLSLIKPEIYLPGDIIMSVNDDEPRIFFLLYGTCSVCLPTGTELVHQEDGAIFGNVSHYLFGRYKPEFIYYVVALEACEIYWLSKEEIKYCCDHHSDLSEKIRIISREREKKYNDVFSHVVRSETSIVSLGVVDELRRGRILDHGIQRDVFLTPPSK